ncbi:MAG: hypothetical protein AAF616_14145 [Bacteroidota bacterium]
MKRLLNRTLVLVAGILFISCSNEYELPGEEPSHFSVYLSEEFFGNQVQVGGHIDFADVSQGIQSRKWTFPEGVVRINGEMVTETDEVRFRAFFEQAGVYEVTLEQEYAGSAWIDTVQVSNVIDTTYQISVLDSVSAAFAAEVVEDMSPLVIGTSNSIEAGSIVRLISTSTGGPTRFSWFMEGSSEEEFIGIAGSSNNGSDVTFQYKSLGTYDVMMIASRARPFGADTVIFEDMITVGPSTKPVLTLDVWRQAPGANNLNITFSRDIASASMNRNDFSVEITTASGGTVTPSIAAVSLQADDASTIVLTLAQPVYTDDIITVSYNKGSLETTDFAAVESFSSLSVGDSKINLLQGYDMEADPSSTFNIGAWGGIWDMTDYEKTGSEAVQGSNSYLTTIAAAGAGIATGKPELTFLREAGKTYELGLWLYIVDVGDGNGEMSVIFAGRNQWQEGVYFTNAMPTGQWFYHVVNPAIEAVANAETPINIRPNNQMNSQPVVFYMDDFTVKEVVNRP